VPSRRWFIIAVALVSACGHGTEPTSPPPAAPVNAGNPPSTKPASAHTAMFGDVAIADGAIAIMDGGIHGVQGHRIVIDPAGAATWERRLDGMQPSGKAGKGAFAPAADELARARDAAAKLWELAPQGRRSFSAPIEDGPPRWVWAVVLRRGDEVRVVDGGSIDSPQGAPGPARPLLEWLVKRVDGLSVAAP
jgi:hypothetical protein